MRLSPDQKAGLFITAIVHLAVIVVLLLCQIGYSVQRENTFVLDFTQQEEKERIEQQEELHRNALAQLEEMISVARSQPVRNVTVNRSQLKDDRGTDADQLYRDAERLAQDLRDGQHRQLDNQGSVVDAKVDEGASSRDGCLRSFATRAARLSKFNASSTAPARQMGTITYQFIAQ